MGRSHPGISKMGEAHRKSNEKACHSTRYRQQAARSLHVPKALGLISPQNAVLGSNCQTCGRALGVHIYWFWNRRECYKCITEVTISSSALVRQYNVPSIAFEHLYSMPYNSRRTRGVDDKGERYLLGQINDALEEYEKVTRDGAMGMWLMDCTLNKHKRSLEIGIAAEMEKAAKIYVSVSNCVLKLSLCRPG